MRRSPLAVRLPSAWLLGLVCLAAPACGCGSTKSRLATEQLVLSDAVDHAVAEIDFRPLAGRKVFLDTRYVQNVKTNPGNTVVTADYIISSLRQQMAAADCRLQDKVEDAEVIVEARVGALGTDANEVVYGIPANNASAAAAALIPNAPPIPAIPEISVGRWEAQLGAAKLAVFAYDRETRRALWQSGLSRAKSTANDLWVFGVGPFQRGTVVEGTQFAGSNLPLPGHHDDGSSAEGPLVAYGQEHVFPQLARPAEPAAVNVAGFAEAVPPAKAADAPPGKKERSEKQEAPQEGERAKVTDQKP